MLTTYLRVARLIALCVWCATVSSTSLRSQFTRPAVSQLPAFDVMEKSIEELQRAMQSGAVTSRDLVIAYLLPHRGVRPTGPLEDGLPIGMDLLGGAFKELELMSLGFSIEGVLRLRRTPFSTPALVSGKRPPPKTTIATLAHTSTSSSGARATVSFAYDETTSQLAYAVQADAGSGDVIEAIWIHAGTVEKPGAARHLIYRPGQPMTGSITLTASDRKSLTGGAALLRLHIRGVAGSAADVPLVLR